MRKLLIALSAVILLFLLGGVWFLAELNRFRPMIEERFAAETGTPIRIQGDLGWWLVPSPAITAASVKAVDGSWRVQEFSFSPLAEHYRLAGLQFQTPSVSGLCDLNFDVAHWPQTSVDASNLPLMLDVLGQVNGDGKCDSIRIKADGQVLGPMTATLAAAGGDVRIRLQGPDVLGGVGQLRLDLSAKPRPAEWDLHFNVENLRARKLGPWLGPEVHWEGAVDLTGDFHLIGDAWPEMASSAVGAVQLDGEGGRIYLRQLGRALKLLASVSGAGESAFNPLAYSKLEGDWKVDATDHRLSLNLDSLSIDAQGQYQIARDELNLTAKLIIEDSSAATGFPAGDILQGRPFQVRCRGTLASPNCALDMESVVRLIADMAQDTAPQSLDAVIKRVPPAFQDTAKSMLEFLRRGRDENRR